MKMSKAPPQPPKKKKPLTFTEKELKEVLLEEYEWQRAQVQDLLKRLEKRREG